MLRALWLAPAVCGLVILLACGIGIRRDYSTVPVGQIGFDDLCGLQDYFDTIEAQLAKPPTVVSALDIESDSDRRVRGGKNRFLFDTDFQLKNLRRVLDQNWSRVPETVTTAKQIEIEVHWSEKAGVRRVVTGVDSEIVVDNASLPLPYHVCLSEILFGEPLYHQRREMMGGTLPYRSLLGDGGLAAAPGDGAPTPTTTLATAPANAPATDGGLAATPAPTSTATHPVAAAPAPAKTAIPIYDGGPPAPLHPTFKTAPPAQ